MISITHLGGARDATSIDRRPVLQALGTVTVVGVAGCTGSATSDVNGRDGDDDLAAVEFGDHGEADVRYLVPEEMSPTAQMIDDGGTPLAVIAGSPGITYEETIEFYRESDGEGDWAIADEGGDEEADGESVYEFSATRDGFEATISLTGFGSHNVTLWIGVRPR